MRTPRPAPVPDLTRGAHTSNVPRLALSLTEAATALGVSLDFFGEHVAHELAIVRRGRRRLVAVAELERWLERNAERVIA